jgi:Ca2+/H+ antiporter, TMEM165/GDT1 family
VDPFLIAVAVAFGAIFVAEFGDKSQLLILGFATRHPARLVIAGLVLAAAVVQGISVAIGSVIGALLPQTLVLVVSGVAFLGVAAWTLRGDDTDGDDTDEDRHDAPRAPKRAAARIVLAVAGTFIVGELGDKTMLATFALAAAQGPIPTWIGSTAGEVAANLVAVAVGSQVGRRLSPRAVRYASAGLFALTGLAVLAGAVLGATE